MNRCNGNKMRIKIEKDKGLEKSKVKRKTNEEKKREKIKQSGRK